MENMQTLRALLEARQIALYFGVVVVATLVALLIPASTRLETAINPALALMLFLTFFQIPFADFRRAISRGRFLMALLLTDFIAIPLLVALLFPLLPPDPLVRLGVLLVLLAPCIDYVVTFAHLGGADAQALVVATPILLIVQMVLLPVYLRIFLGDQASGLVSAAPFMHAFLWLIAVPLLLSVLVQQWAGRARIGNAVSNGLGLLPVPATAAVLFVVVASMVPRLGPAIGMVARVVPVYILFAAIAPVIGWYLSRLFGVEHRAGRAIAFSAGTRNSLVILPLALAVPSAVAGTSPTIPAVIIAQTLVELIASLVYVRAIRRLPG